MRRCARSILDAVPGGKYGLADAWTLGRLGGGTSDTLMTLFSTAPDENLKVRYLTLLSFSDDPVATPFLAAIYESPDSAGIPPRAATRASDALLWIGTKQSLEALAAARDIARQRGDLRRARPSPAAVTPSWRTTARRSFRARAGG